jgi:hypothetical protein
MFSPTVFVFDVVSQRSCIQICYPNLRAPWCERKREICAFAVPGSVLVPQVADTPIGVPDAELLLLRGSDQERPRHGPLEDDMEYVKQSVQNEYAHIFSYEACKRRFIVSRGDDAFP